MLFIEHCFHRLDVVLCLLLLSSYLRMNHSSSFMAWKQVTHITLSLRMVLLLCQGWTGSPAELLWPVSSLWAAAPLSQVLYTAHSTRLSTCGMNACVTTTLGLTEDCIPSVTSSTGGFLEHRLTMLRQVAHHIYPNRWRVKSQPCMQKDHPSQHVTWVSWDHLGVEVSHLTWRQDELYHRNWFCTIRDMNPL